MCAAGTLLLILTTQLHLHDISKAISKLARYIECSHRHFCSAPISVASMNFQYLATEQGPE